MPAPVPPGYTRGPLLFISPSTEAVVEEGHHQWLWREAGGFGARMVLITVEEAHIATIEGLRAELAAYECDQITEIVALDRKAAANPVYPPIVEQATGIVLAGDDPLRMAAILGGTPLAQMIRRANARSKLVAAVGTASAFLCQHMITPAVAARRWRETVAFGPGLGLVNRLVIDAARTVATAAGVEGPTVIPPFLLAAVATNPFLIGVQITVGSAAILYPDNTLQANGPNPLTIVDGQAIEAADLEAGYIESTHVSTGDTPSSFAQDVVVGALHYTLHTGEGFNLDDHTLRPAGEIDLPPTGPVTSVF